MASSSESRESEDPFMPSSRFESFLGVILSLGCGILLGGFVLLVNQ